MHDAAMDPIIIQYGFQHSGILFQGAFIDAAALLHPRWCRKQMKCGQLVIVTVVKGQCGLLFLLRPLALQRLGFRFVYTARSGWLAHQNWFRVGS